MQFAFDAELGKRITVAAEAVYGKKLKLLAQLLYLETSTTFQPASQWAFISVGSVFK